jgi:hypothetical protein
VDIILLHNVWGEHYYCTICEGLSIPAQREGDKTVLAQFVKDENYSYTMNEIKCA